MKVGVTLDYRSKGLKLAKQGLKDLGRSALGASLSIGGVTLAIQRMVKAAAEDQRAFANLGQTMRNVGFVGAEHQAKQLFDQLELQHGIVTDDLLPAYRTLFNSLGGLTLTQDALNAAIATSIGGGKDLGQVSSALAKAYMGQTTALSKLNIGFSKAELSGMGFEEILTRLNAKFAGAAAINADQFATKMDRIRLAVNQAKDSIGEGFIFAIEESGRRSGRTIDDITNKIVTLGERSSQYIRLIALSTNQASASMEKSWLGKLLDDVRYNNPTFLGELFQLGALGLKIFNEEAKKLQDPFANYNPSTRADRMTANELAEAMAKNEQRRIRAEYLRQQKLKALEDAKRRGEEARKKRQALLDKQSAELAMKYDTERANIAAALAKAQDEGTKARIKDLLILNTLQYANALGLETMNQVLEYTDNSLKKIVSQQKQWTDEVLRTLSQYDALLSSMNAAAAAQGLGRDAFYSATGGVSEATMRAISSMSEAQAAAALTSMYPELDRGAANPGAYGTQAPINISINALSTMDIEEAIAAAVNTGSRAGLAYTQVFSRL